MPIDTSTMFDMDEMQECKGKEENIFKVVTIKTSYIEAENMDEVEKKIRDLGNNSLFDIVGIISIEKPEWDDVTKEIQHAHNMNAVDYAKEKLHDQ